MSKIATVLRKFAEQISPGTRPSKGDTPSDLSVMHLSGCVEEINVVLL